MTEYLWVAGKAFGISLVLTPIFRDLFRSYNVVDRPGFRKVHSHPIPRIGGIPIAIAYIVTMFSALASTGSLNGELTQPDSIFWKLMPGVILIFATGLLDDFVNLRPIYKLLGQVIAASVVFASGLRITALGGMDIPLWVSFPITLFWLLLTTNALNLIDGLDGLCAGMGLLATLTLFGGALLQHNVGLVHATLPLAGALLGFLCYNFNPASVFLGDSGALMIGFLLGCYGMIWTQKTTALLGVAVPLLALSIPLADVSLSIVRRYLNNRPIFSADRGHIHHRLLDRGLSVRSAALLLYCVAALAAGLALILSNPSFSRVHGLVIFAFGVLVWIGVRQLRYLEFTLVGRVLFTGEFQRSMARKACLERLTHALRTAKNDDDWWNSIVQAAEDAGCWKVRLEMRGSQFLPGESGLKEATLAVTGGFGNGPGWQFQASLGQYGRMTLEGPFPVDAAADPNTAHQNTRMRIQPRYGNFDVVGFAGIIEQSLIHRSRDWNAAVPSL